MLFSQIILFVFIPYAVSKPLTLKVFPSTTNCHSERSHQTVGTVKNDIVCVFKFCGEETAITSDILPPGNSLLHAYRAPGKLVNTFMWSDPLKSQYCVLTQNNGWLWDFLLKCLMLLAVVLLFFSGLGLTPISSISMRVRLITSNNNPKHNVCVSVSKVMVFVQKQWWHHRVKKLPFTRVPFLHSPSKRG